MEHLKADQAVYEAIQKELGRQRDKLEMIASENIVSYAVMEAQGSVLTNKYAEGYPGKRYYGGCEYVDIVEQLAIDRAKELFGAEHVNVQPHSGSQANFAVYYGLLNPGDTVMGMNLTDGGHLTHGSTVNISGNYFNFVPYGVRKEDELLDYEAMEKIAKEVQPKLIIGGTSAYSRIIDFERIAAIAKEVGALFMVDMAHFAGLVAGGEYPSPIPWADIVTTTTHKTLRGPRGGVIMCKEQYAKAIDKAVFPGMQGGPLMHIIAAKAVAFGEALSDDFKQYAKQIKRNEKVLSDELQRVGIRVVSGGTDTHVLLADMQAVGTTGKIAQNALDEVGITVNKNTIPFETLSPFVTSGIRLGSPALTTRGLVEEDFVEIADIIATVVKNPEDEAVKSAWVCYIPAAISGTATIFCIFGANVLSKRQQAALTSAYALLNDSYNNYKDKLKELYGEEAHQKIVDAIAAEKAKDVYITSTGLVRNSSLDFDEHDPNDERLFYDAYSNRYFESSINRVIQAEYHLNRDFVISGYLPANHFYQLLGLEPLEGGDTVGWSIDTGIYWIDFNHSKVTLDDGLEVLVIDMDWVPDAGWDSE